MNSFGYSCRPAGLQGSRCRPPSTDVLGSTHTVLRTQLSRETLNPNSVPAGGAHTLDSAHIVPRRGSGYHPASGDRQPASHRPASSFAEAMEGRPCACHLSFAICHLPLVTCHLYWIPKISRPTSVTIRACRLNCLGSLQ